MRCLSTTLRPPSSGDRLVVLREREKTKAPHLFLLRLHQSGPALPSGSPFQSRNFLLLLHSFWEKMGISRFPSLAASALRAGMTDRISTCLD